MDLKKFKIFGCTALIYFPLPSRTKLDVTAERGTLVGMSERSLCYQVYCHLTKHVLQVHDATFIEDDEDQLIIDDFSPIALEKQAREA